jgi:hypothetical protein
MRICVMSIVRGSFSAPIWHGSVRIAIDRTIAFRSLAAATGSHMTYRDKNGNPASHALP